MKQQRRIHVRDENDLHSILQKDGSDVKQFGTGASDGAAALAGIFREVGWWFGSMEFYDFPYIVINGL